MRQIRPVADWLAPALFLATWTCQAAAQPVPQPARMQIDTTALSKQSENPLSRIITVPLRYQADFLDGPYRATKSTFELDQALLPIRLNRDWTLVTRTKMPVLSQPPKQRGESWVAGFGNGYTTFFLSPSRGDGLYWGAGPVLFYPTATSPALGVNKWGAGPSIAFFREQTN